MKTKSTNKLTLMSVRLPEMHKLALECLAITRNATKSTVFREAIELYCNKQGFGVEEAPEVYRKLKEARIRYESAVKAAKIEFQKAVKGEKL